MKYSNPRLNAIIPDWPIGRDQRAPATFTIEQNKQGERAIRTTTGAAKKLTYAVKARIVDGEDGRTYIANLTLYGHVSIMRGDMKFSQETINENDARYPEVLALFSAEVSR